jgi:hypothetical protein
MFDMDQACNKISHQLDFQIQVRVNGKNIFHAMVYEGASNCIIPIAFWKSLGSPNIYPSNCWKIGLDSWLSLMSTLGEL